jgi:DNA-binding NarL/FixJ family response regulator
MNSWIILQFAVDILLLSIIIFYIIKDSLSKNKPQQQLPALNELKTLAESLQQLIIESEKIAARLEKNINEEKRLSGELQDSLDKKSKELNLSIQRAESLLKKIKEFQNTASDTQPVSSTDKYDEVYNLFKKGLSKKEIAEKAGLSESEVELICNLRREKN